MMFIRNTFGMLLYLSLYTCSSLLAPPKFVTAPSGDKGCPLFNNQIITLGDSGKSPSCTLCVHCFVDGTPSPNVTWEYNGGAAGYVSVLTNQSNQSSMFSTQSNGQMLCFGDTKQYREFSRMYKCTAESVGGRIFACFNAIIDVKTPYPKPGSMATQSAQYLGNRNVSLVMDSNYVEDGSSFRLCCYNRSSPEQLISCCDCFSSLPCDWGIMDNANERGHPMCIVNVSQTGFYQFKIYTSNYPCYLDIGDPIFVYAKQDSDNSDLGLILGISIPGSVVILIVIVGATTVYCRTQRRNDIRREYHQISNEPANKPVSRPLTSPPPANAVDKHSHLLENSEIHTNTSKALPPTDTPPSPHTASNTLQHTIQDDDTFSNSPALSSAPSLQHPAKASGTDSLPLPEQASDHVQSIVPITVPKSTCPPAPLYKKRVYVIHCTDSKQWVNSILKTVLTTINVLMVTIDDAMVGSSISNARYELVDKADKVIVVISPSSRNKWSKENQWSEFELAHARQKDPDSSKIKIIPVLYENVRSEDLPATVSSLVSLRFDATDFKEKVKESIFYEPATSNDILYKA
ncbi:uncharacterized protein [Dysidea avara]|uniref:uncharacterized protein isoform X2 n=1 Tax=Dysidea avara TaxID=196820 RepID=UPI003325E270